MANPNPTPTTTAAVPSSESASAPAAASPTTAVHAPPLPPRHAPVAASVTTPASSAPVATPASTAPATATATPAHPMDIKINPAVAAVASVGHDGETVQTPGRLPPTIPSVSPATAAALPAGAHKADSTTRPAAVAKAELIVNADTPITGTYYLDPCLRHTLFHMPHAFSAATEAALTGMGAYATPQGTTSTAPTTSSTQTPISTASAPTVTPATNTLTAETSGPTPAPAAAAAGRHGESAHHHYAKVAQSWVVPPDARFVSESGPITLSLASIDEATHGVMETKTDADGKPTPVTPRGRTNVRVSVESKTGGVYIDVCDLDPNRQIELTINTEADVFVLLPTAFVGPISITAPHSPQWGSVLYPQLAAVTNTYPSLYTTSLAPPSARQVKGHIGRLGGRLETSLEHHIMKKISKHIPDELHAQDGYVDMLVAGYASFSRDNQSKLVVNTTKGKVVVGYRQTHDEEAGKRGGLKVGAAHDAANAPHKKWWSL